MGQARESVRHLVWLTILGLTLAGCGTDQQPKEADDEQTPIELVMPRTDIHEDPPVAVIYTERWIREHEWHHAQESGEPLLRRPVQLAVWLDGTMIWSSFTVDRNVLTYRQAEVSSARVQAALDLLDDDEVFELGDRQGLIQLHGDHEVILIDAGEHRRLRLSGQPPDEADFRGQWHAARATLKGLIPGKGQPVDVTFSF